MNLLLDSVQSAFLLLISWDPELFEIVGVSLKVSFGATLIASILGIPASHAIYSH